MRFSTVFVSFVMLLAGSVEANNHMKKHYRRGVSATFGGSPTSTPSSSTPSSTPTPPPSGGSGSGKRGLAFNDISLTKNFNSKEVTWAYNWDSTHSGTLPNGVAYFPMLWSDAADHTNGWADRATAAINAGSRHLLAFNEPDLSSQANMSPQAAADAWMTYMEPFHGKAILVSPAITNGGAPMGTAWMDQFLQLCSQCHVDKIAIHIYDSATNIGYYENYISSIGTKYNKQVLVTEFGATGSSQQQVDFMNQIAPFLDELASVDFYAYFGVFSGVLVNSDGSLSALGQAYAS